MSTIAATTAPPEPSPEGSAIRVRLLEAGQEARWDAFVEACPAASVFHLARWGEAVRRALGHRTWYLYAEGPAGIEGVLPLGHVKSWFFGNALLSTPFAVYGGIAATTAVASRALLEAGRDLARELKVDYLELRHREAREGAPAGKDLYVTFRKAISTDADANMKALPRKRRATVRKGIQAALQTEIDAGVDRFFEMYQASLRNLGTPVLPLRWFATLKELFGERCEVLTITRHGAPVASVLSFYFRDEVLPYYGGGAADARRFRANDFMYWELMRRACERGVRLFDYGRSKRDTGSYRFKKNWGFEPQPLHYEHHLIRAREIPEINPLNPKYRMMIRTWRWLPLRMSRVLGPMLARYLG